MTPPGTTKYLKLSIYIPVTIDRLRIGQRFTLSPCLFRRRRRWNNTLPHHGGDRPGEALLDEPELAVQRRAGLARGQVRPDAVSVGKFTAPFHKHGPNASPLVIGVCYERVQV